MNVKNGEGMQRAKKIFKAILGVLYVGILISCDKKLYF